MSSSLDDVLLVLARTPGVLRSLLQGLPQRLTESNYGPGTWSPREVVAHLVFGERTDWVPRAKHILEVGERRPFDPFDRAGHQSLMAGRSCDELLEMFASERAESLRAIESMRISADDLGRPGRHPALGAVTLENLLATWAAHDLNHVHQVSKGLAFQFADRVGPWQAYLSILAPPTPR